MLALEKRILNKLLDIVDPALNRQGRDIMSSLFDSYEKEFKRNLVRVSFVLRDSAFLIQIFSCL